MVWGESMLATEYCQIVGVGNLGRIEGVGCLGWKSTGSEELQQKAWVGLVGRDRSVSWLWTEAILSEGEAAAAGCWLQSSTTHLIQAPFWRGGRMREGK